MLKKLLVLCVLVGLSPLASVNAQLVPASTLPAVVQSGAALFGPAVSKAVAGIMTNIGVSTMPYMPAVKEGVESSLTLMLSTVDADNSPEAMVMQTILRQLESGANWEDVDQAAFMDAYKSHAAQVKGKVVTNPDGSKDVVTVSCVTDVYDRGDKMVTVGKMPFSALKGANVFNGANQISQAKLDKELNTTAAKVAKMYGLNPVKLGSANGRTVKFSDVVSDDIKLLAALKEMEKGTPVGKAVAAVLTDDGVFNPAGRNGRFALMAADFANEPESVTSALATTLMDAASSSGCTTTNCKVVAVQGSFKALATGDPNKEIALSSAAANDCYDLW